MLYSQLNYRLSDVTKTSPGYCTVTVNQSKYLIVINRMFVHSKLMTNCKLMYLKGIYIYIFLRF